MNIGEAAARKPVINYRFPSSSLPYVHRGGCWMNIGEAAANNRIGNL